MRKTKITGAKRRAAGLAAALFLTALLASGCQGGKEKYAFRETGISQMDAGDYEGAIQSFEQALEHSDGFVGEFELDVLKYRAEAEYALADYAASAHTYDILVQADGERPEYLNRGCVMHALAGDTEAALACYEKAFAQAPEEEETAPVVRSISITSNLDGQTEVVVGTPVTLTATLGGFEDVQVALQWQCSTDGGATFADLPEATDTALTFNIDMNNVNYLWRLKVTVLPEAQPEPAQPDGAPQA